MATLGLDTTGNGSDADSDFDDGASDTKDQGGAPRKRQPRVRRAEDFDDEHNDEQTEGTQNNVGQTSKGANESSDLWNASGAEPGRGSGRGRGRGRGSGPKSPRPQDENRGTEARGRGGNRGRGDRGRGTADRGRGTFERGRGRGERGRGDRGRGRGANRGGAPAADNSAEPAAEAAPNASKDDTKPRQQGKSGPDSQPKSPGGTNSWGEGPVPNAEQDAAWGIGPSAAEQDAPWGAEPSNAEQDAAWGIEPSEPKLDIPKETQPTDTTTKPNKPNKAPRKPVEKKTRPTAAKEVDSTNQAGGSRGDDAQTADAAASNEVGSGLDAGGVNEAGWGASGGNDAGWGAGSPNEGPSSKPIKRPPLYVNPDRVKTGGSQKPKLTEEELSALMEKRRLQNEKIKEKRLEVEADAEKFAEEQAAAKARQDAQAKIQTDINLERQKIAEKKVAQAERREWDVGKVEKGDRSEGFEGRGRGRGGRGRGGRGRGRGGGPLSPSTAEAPNEPVTENETPA